MTSKSGYEIERVKEVTSSRWERRVATSGLGVDYFFVVLRGGYFAQAGQSPGEESCPEEGS